MKTKIYTILMAIMVGCLFSACRDNDYPDGLAEYEHYYYAGFLPWNNTKIAIDKTKSDLVELEVQFHSEYIRTYDVSVKYFLKNPATGDIAKVGVDFEIVDKQGNKIEPVEAGVYELVFPKAQKGKASVYVKPLNNPVAGKRSVIVALHLHDDINTTDSESRINTETSQYTVATFTQACKRPLEFE